MLSSRTFGVLLLSSLLGGCLSGQTGSPDCNGPRSCVCDTLYGGGVLLRVHGEAAEDGKLVAVVDEVLGNVFGSTDVGVSDRVGGSVSVEKPCEPEARSPSLESAELLVLFIPGRNGDYPQCESEPAEVCAEQRAAALLDGDFRFVVPWADELDFGAEHRLQSSEVSALSSPEACWEHFPLGATPPCNDSTVVCSVSRPSPAPNSLPWATAGVGLTLLGIARRRGKRATSIDVRNS